MVTLADCWASAMALACSLLFSLPSKFLHSMHLQLSEHRILAWKHSQYFLRHPDLLQVSRSVTKGLLVHLGCDVMTVSSEDECLRAITQEHQVVFMDICISGVDGYEIAVRIHEMFSKCHERPLIVALTGNTDRVTKEHCLRVGMDGVILKPVSVDKMRIVLSELLEHRVLFEA
ncbi:hypothetical protein RJ640_026738 [Escallonia rubra]|uniref:Response regulatory domain-containing protein n=1 Tax=Escallonia rubra TaxID=112253 RepID=A0AA88U7I8_9ASTE|nr:hypothetical protein RJ640_026738 [Escallonia rubra]